jgi:hypothetical protein
MHFRFDAEVGSHDVQYRDWQETDGRWLAEVSRPAAFLPLFRIGWSIKREAGSHRILARVGWPDFVSHSLRKGQPAVERVPRLPLGGQPLAERAKFR